MESSSPVRSKKGRRYESVLERVGSLVTDHEVVFGGCVVTKLNLFNLLLLLGTPAQCSVVRPLEDHWSSSRSTSRSSVRTFAARSCFSNRERSASTSFIKLNGLCGQSLIGRFVAHQGQSNLFVLSTSKDLISFAPGRARLGAGGRRVRSPILLGPTLLLADSSPHVSRVAPRADATRLPAAAAPRVGRLWLGSATAPDTRTSAGPFVDVAPRIRTRRTADRHRRLTKRPAGQKTAPRIHGRASAHHVACGPILPNIHSGSPQCADS